MLFRSGGVIAFITSKGTMDKENSAVRKYLAQRADLIGAIRLPDNTFKQNAEQKSPATSSFCKSATISRIWSRIGCIWIRMKTASA